MIIEDDAKRMYYHQGPTNSNPWIRISQIYHTTDWFLLYFCLGSSVVGWGQGLNSHGFNLKHTTQSRRRLRKWGNALTVVETSINNIISACRHWPPQNTLHEIFLIVDSLYRIPLAFSSSNKGQGGLRDRNNDSN
jgi:hypothetical protein